MNALILLAHGSRNVAANEEVAALAAEVGRRSRRQPVTYAFLEVAEPTLQRAVEQLAGDNAAGADVLPLFLNTGNHVLWDIPNLVSELRKQFPRLNLRILPHIGSHSGYKELVMAAARERDTTGS